MKKTKKIIREGFWRGKDEPTLPKPVPRAKPRKGQRIFLKALSRLEYRLKPAYFKGWSECRVCGCRNGSGEYTHGGFQWPTGFYHYVKVHNVKPTDGFIEFVLLAAGDGGVS